MSEGRARILVAKPGLDGHDRGAKVVARALRDAGFEVIYTGLHQTPEMIAEAAIQEDVDCLGISILSGAHNTLFPAILDEIKQRDARIIGVAVADLLKYSCSNIRPPLTVNDCLGVVITCFLFKMPTKNRCFRLIKLFDDSWIKYSVNCVAERCCNNRVFKNVEFFTIFVSLLA